MASPRFALDELTIVAESSNYVVGNRESGRYLAVPEVGALVVGWLIDGLDPVQCAERASEHVGQPVDVEDFLQVLTRGGVLRSATSASPARRRTHSVLRVVGTAVFSRYGWTLLGALTLAAGLILVLDPERRPRSADLVLLNSPLASIVVTSSLVLALTLLHESAHMLAAARLGVRSSLSVSRRLYFVAVQADLTRLWGVPRRNRYAPLLAGLAVDSATVGLLLLLEPLLPGGLTTELARATVFVQISALVLQTAIFARTDLYAVLVVASRCQQLWRTKSAVLHQLLRRASASDRVLLAKASRAELTWARGYLLLYLPGIAAAGWYLIAVTLPALLGVLRLAYDELAGGDLGSSRFYQGCIVAVLVVGPAGWALVGALMSGWRSVAAVIGPRASRASR